MPIDVSYPIPLLEDILADSQPAAIVTEQSLTQYIPGRTLSFFLVATIRIFYLGSAHILCGAICLYSLLFYISGTRIAKRIIRITNPRIPIPKLSRNLFLSQNFVNGN